ncbi:Alpha/beta hydrolase fold-1 [Macleaya cordata]|uniref:Alpha/beta hydrolase fold-1 n=1 Tax=Macleaya cordata TaxID=56857 RepID=A0A200Q0E3_MACCD|nr:Alpha/beta hydrolase fold-1 [Macleaya cordata]
MFKFPATTTSNWSEKAVHNLISEEKKNNTINPCHCENRGAQGRSVNGDDDVDGEVELSETLYQRKNIFRDMGYFLNKLITKERQGSNSMKKYRLMVKNRWSDCKCDSCLSWQKIQDQKLHVVVKEPSQANNEDCRGKPVENVIFLHGFLGSSSFWTKSVFPNLSATGNQNCRLFALDLLGFGKSPKPSDCFYTMKDHLEMVERSVINQFQLESFHLVAHSMGCIIALALAAKYKKSVKSITLVAAPYFPLSKEKASLNALNKLAERRVWPPFLFGASVMSWYEHLGRTIYFLGCRSHGRMEWLLKLLTRRRQVCKN